MGPKTHLLSSLALAVVRYPHRPLAAALVVAGGTMIDVDHFLLYALQTGDWSLSGALHYNRYRHTLRVRGDTRPRYGSLRSLIHHPWILLPLIWIAAGRRRFLRPVALGLSLHLALDYMDWPRYKAAMQRAGGRCAVCGAAGRPLQVVVRRRQEQLHYEAQCRRCRERFVGEAEPIRAGNSDAG
ncbi:MAG: hypothetical protein HC822_10840 [Oscillochloris sp.]|nr:hypothetical protein [Oscillochloris sp.]